MKTVLKEDLIEEIKTRSNIVDIIGRYVNIKRAGINYKGLCPFHSEDTPSFIISEDKQIFTCFGCGATGDVIEFIKRIENIDFIEAVEKLAKECGVEIQEHSDNVNEKKKEQLYQINRDAALFFYNNFTKNQNAGLDYMQLRGIDQAVLRKFGIGYAENSWNGLYNFFKNKNISEKILLNLGLLSISNKEKYYDKFRNRVIFPIINTRGKIIGFGGRAIDDAVPKYLNSPESIVFQKKNNLYGLNLTRQEIQKQNFVILVEGYMDVISLYQKGIKNVAASLGTALTVNQAHMLKRYTDHVIIGYDSDEAGQAAALRAMEILFNSGCKVKILKIKGFKDPDEYVKAHGKDAFMELVKQAVPLIEYKLNHLKKHYDLNTTNGRVEFVKKVAEILSSIKSPVEMDAYVHKIAAETKISESAIKLEINGNNSDNNIIKIEKLPRQEYKNIEFIQNDLLEKNLIKLMITRSEFIPSIKDYSDIFINPSHRSIFDLIVSLYTEDEEIDLIQLKDSLSNDEDINALDDIIENVHFGGKESQIFNDCINRIKNDRLKKRQEEIINILQILDEEEDYNRIEQLTNELLEIQKNLSK